MSWWNGISDWWNGEDEEAAAQAAAEAERAAQAAKWRQAVAPTTAPTVQGPRADPLEAALAQWRNTQAAPTATQQRTSTSDILRPTTTTAPMQGPLRPGETRPMVPSVGPVIAPPAAPEDRWGAALDAWRAGPPQQETAKPWESLGQFDVQQPTVDFALNRPDAGVNAMTGQQQQAPTVSSPTAPFDPYAPQPEDAWGVTRYASQQPYMAAQPTIVDAAKYAWQQLGGWQGAQKIAGLSTDYAKEVGPVDWALKAAFGATPGYDYLEQQAKDSLDEGSNQGLDAFGDNAWNVLTALQLPQKAIEQTEIPYSGDILGGNKEDVTIAQAGASIGSVLNQALNPLYRKNPLADMSYSEVLQDVGAALGGLKPSMLAQMVTGNLTAAQELNETFKNLPPELRTQANIALVNQISGPDRTQNTIETILTQDTMVASMEQAAQMMLDRAQQAESMDETQKAIDYRVIAAQYGAAANELKNKSAADIVDDNANPWAELVGGIIFDPLNIPLSGGQEALQAAKSAALMNMNPEQAIKALDGVLDNATKAAAGNTNTWLNNILPWVRTADTNAHMATDTLWRAATNIMSGVTDKTTAKAVLNAWTSDPRQLVEGVVLPGSTEISKWGPGVVANSELLKQYPLLVKTRDALLNMASLTGDPATFSPKEFFSEFNEVLYKSSRESFGVKTLDNLPAGAVNFRVVRAPDGTSIVEYVDKVGKVLKKSEAMLPTEAAQEAAQLKKAVAGAAAGAAGGQNKLAAAWGLQKSILSDMYLGMSPGYWIKNATSAAATLITDNTMTLLPTNAILNDMMMKFGGIAPTTRTAEAAGSALGQAAGEALGGLHWSEKLFGKDNPYAKLMNRLYKIPFGATDIGGVIPFGEQNFALRATYVPFKRYLTSQWSDAAKGFEQTLTGLGIDPNLAKSLSATVADVGINGNKQQMATTLRKLTSGQVIPFSLKELGVPDELISAPGWAKLNTLLTESLPNQLDEAAAQVSEIFGQEFKQAGELLNSAPPQPGRYVWTEMESVQDGADVVDSMAEAAKRAGMPGDVARQEAQGLMKQIADTEAALWTTLRQDLAGATDPQSLNVAMDLLAKWYDWRTTARQQVDQLSKAAIAANSPEAWSQKFEGTKQIYGGFTDFFQKATDEARQNLIKLEQGGQVEGAYDWFDVIKRYASYDEAEVRAARTAGMGVGSPQAPGDVFTKALDANRKYVDKSAVELFSAFRRYPSQNSLDLMADGLRKMEDLGAKAAAFLADKRTSMLPNKADAYYKLRNQVWAEFFDNAVVHNNVVKRLIVASGVADMAKGALKWTDDFAGGEFQLVGKLADGYWQARNIATGALERFADPVGLAQKRKAGEAMVSSMPEVPLKVLQDFYRVIGENTNIVDTLIKELDTEAAARYAAQEAEMMKRAAEWTGEAPPIRWTGQALDPTAPANLAVQAQEMAAGSNEARLALRDEWDRVAKAAGGFPKIDQLIARYMRQGIVNVPENMFEDLYGATVAGRRLENSSDVERFLQEYYDLGQQAKRAPASVEQAAYKLTQAVGDQPTDYAKFTMTPSETDFGAGLGQVFGGLIDQLQKARTNPYAVTANASGWNPWGIAESAKQTDLYKLISGINSNLTDLLGKKAPEMGEVAQHTIRTLGDAEKRIIQRLPEILAGKPNTMTPAQQLRVLDTLQEMLPQYDNILAGAVRTGEQMGNYAMLNYSDKRNMDVWLASIMPYHYFWSRSAKNWLERAVQKPGVINMWYESQRAIEMENNQNNVPEYLRGTVQNPLAQYGIGEERMLNPLTFALPFAMYLGSDFVNPDEARSELERWMLTVKKYTPAMYPVADYAYKALEDQRSPLPGGKRRTDEFQLGDVLPLYKMAGYGYQAATGDMSMSQGPLGYGDEFDYGRAGKQTGLAGLRGEVNPQDAMWAPDVGYQQQTGANALPEQSAGAAGAWQQGAQAAGGDRFQNRAWAFLTGMPMYDLSPEEQQMREMKETRQKLGYNEVTNKYGSKEAVNAYTNMQPDQFDATFNYSALYPQGDDRKRQRPGEGAVQTEYYNQHGVIMNDMTQAVAKYLIANPDATSKELNDFKAPYWDKVEELKGKYPSLPASETKHLNTKYMNPVEHGAAFVQSILSHKPAGKPVYPGQDATAEQKKQYYLDKAKWDTTRLDYYDRQFTQLLNQDDTYPDPWKEAARKMVKDMYASELLRGYENRYAGDVEKAWSDRQSFVEEVQDAQYKLNDKNVLDRVGQQGSELLSQYYALPKGSEERKQFKQANPIVQAAIMASFQPAEYDQFVQKFGPDAFAMIAGAPQHPGDGASEAQLQDYYAQLDAYAQQYPNAEAAKLWLNGRRFGSAEGSDSYGAAYDEAVSIFGPNIFDIMNNVPQGKDAFVAWMKSSPEQYMLYTGYKEWKKEFSDQDKATMAMATTPEEEVTIPNAGAGEGYTGPRPVGSERQAIGSFDPYAGAGAAQGEIDPLALGWASAPAQEQPNPWVNRNWDNLLSQPASNPWTQRANELNAGILGGENVPSQMTSAPREMGPQAQRNLPDWGGDKPTTGGDMKTARDYANMNDKWVKGEMTRAEWAARRSNVLSRFGKEDLAVWEGYYALPQGEAREKYKADNPGFKLINLYAYNRDETEAAMTEVGIDGAMAWTRVPAYADTPEAKAARAQYYDANPKAFLFGAYLNGRPANYDESTAEGDEFKKNWGADYLEAKKLFGDNIWEIVSQYKRGWDGTQARLWREKNPAYNAWSAWWYGSEQREYKGSGMGGYAPFGGYNKQERKTQVRIQDVYGQEMARGLAEPSRVAGYQNPQIDLDWLNAGKQLRPGEPQKWTPNWIRGIKTTG